MAAEQVSSMHKIVGMVYEESGCRRDKMTQNKLAESIKTVQGVRKQAGVRVQGRRSEPETESEIQGNQNR